MDDLAKWENWDKLKVTTAKFILDQSEKKLIATIETAKILTDRTVVIMQLVVGLTIGLLSYSSSTENRGLLFQLAIIILFFCAVIFFYCLKGYNLYEIKPLGNTAGNMINEDKVKSEEQELLFVFSHIRTIDDSIGFNDKRNENRARNLNLIFDLIKIGFSSIIGYSAIFSLFHL